MQIFLRQSISGFVCLKVFILPERLNVIFTVNRAPSSSTMTLAGLFWMSQVVNEYFLLWLATSQLVHHSEIVQLVASESCLPWPRAMRSYRSTAQYSAKTQGDSNEISGVLFCSMHFSGTYSCTFLLPHLPWTLNLISVFSTQEDHLVLLRVPPSALWPAMYF